MRKHRRAYDHYSTSKGFITGTTDSRNVDKMLERLELKGKDGKKVIKLSCTIALQVINEDTAERAGALKLQPSGLKKGWRKTMQTKTAFNYKNRKNRAGNFWFYSAINYKKPILRLSHLIEKGFKHSSVGFVAGHWFRDRAFRQKRAQALTILHRNLMHGMRMITQGKTIPNLKAYKKGLPR